MAPGRRPGEPCRRQLERSQACWCECASSPARRLQAHLVDDERTPVAALRHEARVAQALHQRLPRHGPCARGPSRCSSACLKTRSRASTGSRRERRPPLCPPCPVGSVNGVRSSCRNLMNEAGPAVRDQHQRRGVFVFRPHVQEMNVQPVDVRLELWVRVQPLLLRCLPVVVCSPSSARALCIVASGTPCD